MIINENNMLIRYFEEDIDVINEKQHVSTNNQIQLEYIPNLDLNISVYKENGDEIADFELGDAGVITFNSDLTRKTVYVNYTAIGEWMISAEKVYINYTNKNEVLETLEDLIDEQYKIIEQIKVIGDVQTIITQMQGNIDNLRELYDIVLNNETILENIKVRIDECIAEKDRMVAAVNAAISSANTSKQALEQATNTANTTKDDIVNTTNTCKSEINNLVSGKKTEMTSFTNEKKEELTTTSTGCVNNVNTAINNASDKINELNTWVDSHGDIVELDSKVSSLDADKQNKTDEALVTEDKTIVGAINEIFNNSIRGSLNSDGFKKFKCQDGVLVWQWGTVVISNANYDTTKNIQYITPVTKPFYPMLSCHDMGERVVVSTKNVTTSGFTVDIKSVAPVTGSGTGIGAVRIVWHMLGIE